MARKALPFANVSLFVLFEVYEDDGPCFIIGTSSVIENVSFQGLDRSEVSRQLSRLLSSQQPVMVRMANGENTRPSPSTVQAFSSDITELYMKKAELLKKPRQGLARRKTEGCDRDSSDEDMFEELQEERPETPADNSTLGLMKKKTLATLTTKEEIRRRKIPVSSPIEDDVAGSFKRSRWAALRQTMGGASRLPDLTDEESEPEITASNHDDDRPVGGDTDDASQNVHEDNAVVHLGNEKPVEDQHCSGQEAGVELGATSLLEIEQDTLTNQPESAFVDQVTREKDREKLVSLCCDLYRKLKIKEDECSELRSRPETWAKDLKTGMQLLDEMLRKNAGGASGNQHQGQNGKKVKMIPLVKGEPLTINEDDLTNAISYGIEAGGGQRALRWMINKILESIYTRIYMGTHSLTGAKHPGHKDGERIKPGLPKEDVATVIKFATTKWMQWHKTALLPATITAAISAKLGTEGRELKRSQQNLDGGNQFSELSAEEARPTSTPSRLFTSPPITPTQKRGSSESSTPSSLKKF